VALADCSQQALQDTKLPAPGTPGPPPTPPTNGWTAVGEKLMGMPPKVGGLPEIAAGDHNDGPARGTAQLFTKQVGGLTCFYLRREFLSGPVPPHNPEGTANGVLCFDETDCSVCAWDLKTNPGDDPADTSFSQMQNPSSYNPAGGGMDDCSACHVSGLTMPMQAMYEDTNQIDLMNTCVQNGGVKWVGAPASWAQPNPAHIVPPSEVPPSCNDVVCHTSGFLSPQPNQMAWCDFAGQAFQPGGSMAEDYSQAECAQFMVALACNAVECLVQAAAVPALPKYAVPGLSAGLALATYLALRKRAPAAM
jgi:hypothetical protein